MRDGAKGIERKSVKCGGEAERMKMETEVHEKVRVESVCVCVYVG